MGIVTWVILGIVAGYFASRVMSARDGGLLQFLMVLGIAGAMIGGFSASYFGMGDLQTFSLYGSLFAAFGAAVALVGSGLLLLALGGAGR
jgi:uncharacterized membrane protein YeaQ/YmgE (transglycosylase-associated protein family)